MVRICIGMVRISFKWLKVGFESFESLLNGSNFVSKASNLFRMVRIYVLIAPNLRSNASNPFRMI